MKTVDDKPSPEELRALIEPTALGTLVRSWLKEDIPSFDYAGVAVGDARQTAELLAKSEGVLAGRPFFDAVFKELGCEVEWKSGVEDGLKISQDETPVTLARVTGPARMILLGERVALNTLARCSGIASRSARLVEIARSKSWRGSIAGTRKTTPGFRLVEKYGMLVGGADMHRMDLSSMVMLKDNHINSCGSISNAVNKVRKFSGFSLKIEVECSSYDEAAQAIEAGADVIMLDNFTPKNLHEVAGWLRSEFASHKGLVIEGSGGLSEATIGDYCSKYVDVLSLSIQQGASTVDFSLKIRST